jgi:hypothetical protein
MKYITKSKFEYSIWFEAIDFENVDQNIFTWLRLYNDNLRHVCLSFVLEGSTDIIEYINKCILRQVDAMWYQGLASQYLQLLCFFCDVPYIGF